MSDTKPRIVILGGGFAGINFAKNLHPGVADITLVDRQNHHLFQPLLYQVATAGLSAPEIAQPIRSLFTGRKDIRVIMDEVTDIRLDTKHVVLGHGDLSYDYLVIALGAVTSYFGHNEWAKFAPGLKSLKDATLIRRNILSAFEQAEVESDPARREQLMTVAVIGGGPTGVEMAGALAELTRTVINADFRRIDPAQAKIILIEGSDHILTPFTPYLRESAALQLAALGVTIRLSSRVTNITKGRVDLDNGVILAENIIWGAGVAAHPISRCLAPQGIALDRAGRIGVSPDLSLPGHPEVFALGDIAQVVCAKSAKPVPGVSPAAIQMAEHTAKIINREMEVGVIPPDQRPKFAYWDKGSMATIGRSSAVAMIGKLQFPGTLAWLAWLFVHLLFLVGFRNRVAVLFQWVYSYFTYKRGARIITELLVKDEG